MIIPENLEKEKEINKKNHTKRPQIEMILFLKAICMLHLTKMFTLWFTYHSILIADTIDEFFYFLTHFCPVHRYIHLVPATDMQHWTKMA